MTHRSRLALPFAALALALLLAAPAHAQESPAPGDEAAQQALYQQALQSLAEGRKNDASQALSRLIEKEPLHAGAWLDLALIQCSLGHQEEAERLFAKVESHFAPSRDLLDLIAQARESGCKAWRPVSSLSLLLGRGIDQNVNQGASNPTFVSERGGHIELDLLSDFLPKHDQYSVFSAAYMRDVTPNGSLGFAQYQLRRNDTLHQYDTASLFAGIESPYRFGNWGLRTTGMVGAVTLGGNFYQRQMVLQARVTPPLPLPSSMQFHVLGAATRTDYLTLANFNSNTFELRGQLTHRSGSMFSSVSLGLLSDRARDQRPGGDRHGSFASVSVREQLAWQTIGELAYTRQTWNSSQPYSPDLLIDQVRAQATQVLRGTLSYPIARNHTVQLEARIARNRENISIFQYNSRQLQLSWLWQQ
jgi:hypothetical protein